MEMRKNSIEYFHIHYYNDGAAHLWQNGMVEARSGIMIEYSPKQDSEAC